MILIDSSVWIAHFRRHHTPAAAKLKALSAQEPLLVGDLILLEILQGARDEAHAMRIERALRQYVMARLLDTDLVVCAARNYRKLREVGITVRKTADLIIATFCIERGHTLLHENRDFAPMVRHLGLKAL
ncbi:MAG: PIN domain nuclease [Methylobacteriaceae bacterium]|nr:PIN domain nuclease [Methylobacteriaceae bacterium]